ncbi:MAG: LCP family protein, partial [Actinobacteria bacterium]|nr:LCP family protein [Actinomycetota bacterium]
MVTKNNKNNNKDNDKSGPEPEISTAVDSLNENSGLENNTKLNYESEDNSDQSPELEGLESIKVSEELINEIHKGKEKKVSKFKKLPLYARILIIVFVCIFGLAAAGGGVFYWYINRANKTMNSMTSSEIENILTPVKSIEEPVSILVLGRDSRDPTNDSGRADTIMLLYLDPGQKQATLLSIPRDTLVDIAGYGQDKINAAYAFGGEELMIKTVSNFLNAKINHFVTIDFDGFVKLIDTLGGVDITIERPLIDPKTGANFSAGNHHLTGEQALAYSRSRSTELADIGRIQRQQYLFKGLVDQKLNAQYLGKIPDYFNILVENTKTDLDLLTILRYAK